MVFAALAPKPLRLSASLFQSLIGVYGFCGSLSVLKESIKKAARVNGLLSTIN